VLAGAQRLTQSSKLPSKPLVLLTCVCVCIAASSMLTQLHSICMQQRACCPDPLPAAFFFWTHPPHQTNPACAP
jgi:hypothetical protein